METSFFLAPDKQGPWKEGDQPAPCPAGELSVGGGWDHPWVLLAHWWGCQRRKVVPHWCFLALSLSNVGMMS